MKKCNLINIQRAKLDSIEQEMEEAEQYQCYLGAYMCAKIAQLKIELKQETEVLRKMEEAACRR